MCTYLPTYSTINQSFTQPANQCTCAKELPAICQPKEHHHHYHHLLHRARTANNSALTRVVPAQVTRQGNTLIVLLEARNLAPREVDHPIKIRANTNTQPSTQLRYFYSMFKQQRTCTLPPRLLTNTSNTRNGNHARLFPNHVR